MHKYFGIIACMLILSCKEASKRVNFTADFHFVTQHQNDQLDHQVGPVVVAYQELIKGLNQNDTIYIQQMASQMAQITDSLSRLNLNLDVNRQRIWADGLGNLNAELQGVQMADKINGMDEVKMSIHMCGLQLLYLLAQIGYKEHQVYIYNVEDPNAEDGFVWLSLQKKDRDPFHPQNRKEIIAQEVLQELK